VAGKKVKKTAEDVLENCKAFWRGSDEYAPHGFEMFEVVDPNTDEDKFAMKRKNKNLEEGEKLQEQKDDFERNHDKEEDIIKIKNKERVEKFEEKMTEIAKKHKEQQEKDDANLISNFGLL
jgi:hypothetical protein